MKQRYGNAPITVFFDPKGTFFNAVPRVETYPAHAIFNEKGKRIFKLNGYPFPITAR